MKLIDSKTKRELKRGDIVKDSDGLTYTLQSWREPHKYGSSGFVHLFDSAHGYTREFYPIVIGARFVP